MMATSYLFRPELIDTTPGANALCPFSPPSDFQGEGAGYTELMRRRYKSSEYQRYLRARVGNFVRGDDLQIVGPFTAEATQILALMASSQALQKAG